MTTTVPLVAGPEAFVDELRLRREERLQGLVNLSPRNQPIASDVDPDSCLRRQVLEIVQWDTKAPIPADRQGRLQAGEDAEVRGIQELKAMGYRVVREQVPFELKDRSSGEPVLRGRVDAFIELHHRLDVPVEIKSLFPYIYAAINRQEDFERFWWTKKYPYQLQAYLIGYGSDWGFFWLTNLVGDWKPIAIRLDYAIAEKVWAYSERILAGVKSYRASQPLPDFTKDPLECTRCPFFGRSCNPPIQEMGARYIEDPDFEVALTRRHDLIAGAREFDVLDTQLKKVLKTLAFTSVVNGQPAALAVCGPFSIRVTERRDKVKVVAIEKVGDQPAE